MTLMAIVCICVNRCQERVFTGHSIATRLKGAKRKAVFVKNTGISIKMILTSEESDHWDAKSKCDANFSCKGTTKRAAS